MKNHEQILLKPAETFRMNWPANFSEEDKTDFESEKVYTTYNTYLKGISNAWVSPDSVIYKNGLLIKDSVPARQYEPYYKFRHIAKKIIRGKKVSLDKNKKYLLVTDLWSGGHFHWLCDILPKLLCIQDRMHEFVLLLPDNAYFNTIALESLELLKFNFAGILWMRNDDFYKVKQLYFISKLSSSGRMHSALVSQLRDQFIQDRPAGKKRIYVSRSKAAYRKVLNEAVLLEVLKQYGFEMLQAESLNLKEQIDIFSSSDVLLGIHGAGLTNCIFMPPAGKVIELRKKENAGSNVGYWHLADSLGHQFYYYNGVPDSDEPLVGRGCNLTVPVDDFVIKALAKI